MMRLWRVEPSGRGGKRNAVGPLRAARTGGMCAADGKRGDVDSTQTLQEQLRRQIADERLRCWKSVLAEGKNPRLNTERPSPAPDLTSWENLKPSQETPAPKVQDLVALLEENELGDAKLFQQLHRQKFCFDHSRELWLTYNGVIWENDTLRCAHKAVVDMAELYADAGKEQYRYFAGKKADVDLEIVDLEKKMTVLETEDGDADAKKKLKKEISALEDESARLGKKARSAKKSMDERAKALRAMQRSGKVLSMAALGADSCGLTGKEFNRHPTLLAFANGVVDLETGRLTRSRPDLYLTQSSPYPYPGIHAYSPWWDAHLRKIFCGNDALIDYFERVIGYSATGLQVNKDIWCALGPHANNGKSVTFNAIKKVLGDVATTIKLDVLLEEKGGFRSKGPDPDLMVLDGIRMGIAAEANDKVKFSMERVKAITGGDDVRARGMYADSKIIDSKVKLWLHTNDIPQISGFDPGFMLRLRIIPFAARFVTDPALVDEARHHYRAAGKMEVERRLEESYPQIAAWIVRCARKFLRDVDYVTPSIVLRNTKDYFEEQDNLGKFIEDACETGRECKCKSGDLWKVFKTWCVEELAMDEKHVMSNKRMTAELLKRDGFVRLRTRPTTVWGGLQPTREWMSRGLK